MGRVETSKDHCWIVLCLLSCSMGSIKNQPQKVWTMGRCVLDYVGSKVGYHLHDDNSFSGLAVVTGASEGIGRGYALEVCSNYLALI